MCSSVLQFKFYILVLGTVEVEDQIAVTTYLRSEFRYIDPQRIAVFGLGHGGYMATMILSKDRDKVFKCGVAVNPITNFELTGRKRCLFRQYFLKKLTSYKIIEILDGGPNVINL